MQRNLRILPSFVYVLVYVLITLCVTAVSGCQKNKHLWSEHELAIIKSLSLDSLPSIPTAVSNKYVDMPEAVEFGELLFFDANFSQTAEVSCASCHHPDKKFTDGLIVAKGLAVGTRNTPSIIGSAWQDWQYWDGRKDSLWSQALAPLEAADEIGSTRLEVVRAIGKNPTYRRLYTAIFGEFPFALLRKNLPHKASPLGDIQAKENWYTLSAQQHRQINRVFANIGKALAAYERAQHFSASRFDHYVQALLTEDYRSASQHLDASEIAGLALFLDEQKTQCLRCHNGPRFSNGGFHNIGSSHVKDNPIEGVMDMGRFLGVQSVLIDEFNCLGPYSDANAEDCHQLRFLSKEIDDAMQGAYKTPALRNVALTAPYFHDGRYATLDEVITHYTEVMTNDSEIQPVKLTDIEKQQLKSFLQSLTEVNH